MSDPNPYTPPGAVPALPREEPPWPPGTAEVRFSLSVEDLVEFNIHHMYQSGWTVWILRILQFVGAPAALVTAIVLLVAHGFNVTFPVTLAFTAAIGLAILPNYFFWVVRRATRRVYNSGKHPERLLSERLLALSPEGIFTRTAFGHALSYWISVERIDRGREMSYIYIQNVAAHFVPRKAFSSDERYQQFLALAEQYARAAGMNPTG